MDFGRAAATVLQILSVSVLTAACLAAQDELPGVDLSGLNAAQKASVLKVTHDQGCSCGCSMKIAECREKDPSCTYSKGLASTIVNAVKNGQSEADAVKAAANSQFAHPPGESNRLLEDAVPIATQGAPVLGPKDARVTLVEFSDFQCPYCVAAVPQLQALMKAYPTQVKLIFKQFPLENHSQAAFAAGAALAAHRQGRFWQMHDALFAHHNDLSKEAVFGIAKSLGLDMARFELDLNSPSVQQNIQSDIADGDRAGVQGTPTLFIDGQRFNGPISLDVLKPVLDSAIKQEHKEVKSAQVR